LEEEVVATGGALVVVGWVTGGFTAGVVLGCGCGACVVPATGAALLVGCGAGAAVLPEVDLGELAVPEVVGFVTRAALGAGPEGAAAPFEGAGAPGEAGGFCWAVPDDPVVVAEVSSECADRDITVVKTNVAAIATCAERQVRVDSRLSCVSRRVSRWPGLLMAATTPRRMLRRR